MSSHLKFLALAAATTACSGVQSVGGNCAKVSGAIVDPGANFASYMADYGNPSVMGGYFLARHTKEAGEDASNPENVVTTRCSAIANSTSSFSDYVFFWSASHCIKLARFVEGFYISERPNHLGEGYRQINENGITPADMGINLPRNFNSAAAKSISSEIERRGMLKSIGAGWCKDFTLLHRDESQNQLCVSLTDLQVLPFRKDALIARSSNLASLIPQATDYMGNVSGNAYSTVANWYALYMDWQQARRNDIIVNILDIMVKCEADPSRSECAGFEDFDTSTFLASLNLDVSLVDPDFTSASVVETGQAFSDQTERVRAAWAAILSDSAKTVASLRWSGNYSFESAANYQVLGIDIPSNTAYLFLPEIFKSAQPTSSVIMGDKGFLVNRPRDIQYFDMLPGDSGSVVSFDLGGGVVLPIGVLSTVNGEETSGGLSTRPSAGNASGTGPGAQGSIGSRISSSPGTGVTEAAPSSPTKSVTNDSPCPAS